MSPLRKQGQMKNKEIQEERVKSYFIQATKEILKSEGLKALSVRAVADRAGYSYATMYNYFKDLNELVFYCVEDFFQECRTFSDEQVSAQPNGIARLKSKILAYAVFFTEYPGIFDLFFMERIGSLGNKKEVLELTSDSVNKICQPEWEYCLKHGLVSPNNYNLLQKQTQFMVVGILLLYLNRANPASYPEFISEINSHLDQLLGK